jgi:hypothetical protein
MHPFITGQLADARMADIDRELAHAALRASLRTQAAASRPSQYGSLRASLWRRATSWWPGHSARPNMSIEDGTTLPLTAARRSPAGFVARL